MKKEQMFRSDFLFPDTDFLTGMGSVLNIAGSYFEFATSKSENLADIKALRSDWGVTGQDLEAAYHECTDDSGQK
jgi:ABC-type arginine transport system ATPase subunit